jgi:two-component system chemotaxis sensor kinase CheA
VNDEEVRKRLLATFRVEAAEHLEALGANLLALDREPAPEEALELTEATFREMHTLKGAARSVGMLEVEELCRACESVLSRVTRGESRLTPGVITCLLGAVDHVGLLLSGEPSRGRARDLVARIERVSAAEEHAAPAAETRFAASSEPTAGLPSRLHTIRLATAKLDALLVEAEDLLLPKLAAEERAGEARTLATALTRLEAGSPTEQQAARCKHLARKLVTGLVRDHRRLAASVDGLQAELRHLRMTPAAAILEPFPLMVRNLADEQGKQVDFDVHGAELELDRRILEVIKDPLIHLVRNAVAHGIESPEERAEAGKRPRGSVAITFTPLEGGRIEIAVADDGSGADPAQAKNAAVRARLLTPEEADGLSDDDALDLVYRSGISTTPIITDLSGHGLGLAIVKEQVERLDGRVRFENRIGAGVTVRLVLPSSIATFRGLLVRAGGQQFLLPLEACESVVRIGADDLGIIEGREAIRSLGGAVPVARADAVLGLPSAGRGDIDGNGKHPCVIVRSGEEQIALLADDVVGDREVLVKELGPPLVRVRNVAGAGLLGTGEVVLILRPADLIRSAQELPRRQAAAAAPPPETRQPTILVADDSITTRTMEKNLLEAAGYRVEMAVDGLDAWSALRTGDFDLVVVDIDMPRMDGFELTQRIRGDRDLADLPVVLVTANDSRKGKERGVEVGADAYIVKSSFDQSNLLEIIGRLAAQPAPRVA